MNILRHKRLGGLAAATAVAALAAGTLISAPAVAAGTPDAPHGTTEAVVPESGPLSGPLLPREARRGAFAAAAQAAPRLDADGDGIHDLLYRAPDGRYYVNPSGSDEHFEYTVGDQAGSVEYKDVIPVGKQDQDDLTDLVTLSNDGVLELFRGNGRYGTETWSTWSGKGWNAYNKVLAPGDLTGDGRADLLARTPGGTLYLYQATGNPAAPFASALKIGAGWQGYDQLIGVSDLNGDGRADLLARTTGGDLYRYLGTGKASAPFAAAVKIGFGYQVYNQITGLDDYDGDGSAELFARALSGQTYIYKGNGKGGLSPRYTSSKGYESVRLFAGQGGNPDFGRNDLMGRDSAGTLWWYHPKGNGTLAARQKISDTGGWKTAKITWASSLDRRNDTDIAEVANGGRLYVNGDQISAGWGIYNTLIGPGDLSGDGRGDLLARDGAGVLYLYPGNGQATGFASRVRIGAGWGGFTKLTGAGDLTGDGRGDLVARDGSGRLYLYAGTGNPKAPFKAKVKIGTGYQVYRQLVVTGDLTGDGRADLVATDSAGNLWRYDAYGSGKLTARVKIGTGYGTYPNLY
ncbi:VCBS repeat-containing protein [Streptomyces sp. NPDC097619]|uniref:FG-GAP repeat domain-containing protein n=1 Tax=Streptomyces sp. NPDC097619 TaxID=3157228 RepID=UPI0033230C26